MARQKSAGLTDAELRLMEMLWARGSATVSDVAEGLPKRTPLAYSTVLTTLRILEVKGYLTHTKEGRALVYRPAIGRDQVREKAVTHLLRRFFEGSPELLMLNLVEGRKLPAAELQRIRRRIAEEEES